MSSVVPAEKFVNPSQRYSSVFVFPINNDLKNGIDDFAATSKSWRVSKKNQKLPNATAVGVIQGIAKTCYAIKEWQTQQGSPKLLFLEDEKRTKEVEKELFGKNWKEIIDKAKGFWQRGNYLIVEFDGESRFRIIRGSKNKEWHRCG